MSANSPNANCSRVGVGDMIGILALQGGYQAHQRVLDALNIANREVRLPHDLDDLRGLILPGGESTTMVRLLDAFELFEPLAAFANSKRPVLGTCAGAILMCRTINAEARKVLLGFRRALTATLMAASRKALKPPRTYPSGAYPRFRRYLFGRRALPSSRRASPSFLGSARILPGSFTANSPR